MSPCLLLILSIIISKVSSVIIKSTTLTTSNRNDSNARISVLSQNQDCEISNSKWSIQVCENGNGCDSSTYQRGYHLEIDLDSSWGFHSTKPSTISLKMYSPTSFDVNDLDLLITFSVNSNQYITHKLRLDDGNGNAVYPPCDTSDDPTQTIPTGDVKSCVDDDYCSSAGCSDRFCKATNGNEDSIISINPSSSSPMTITFYNDPILDESYTIISENGWSSNDEQKCGFADSFATDAGLQIYLALDDDNEDIEFSQFDITYSYDTDNPTASPTTGDPTSDPTTTTVLPTAAPSPAGEPIVRGFGLQDESDYERKSKVSTQALVISIIAVIVLILIIAGSVYYYYCKYKQNKIKSVHNNVNDMHQLRRDDDLEIDDDDDDIAINDGTITQNECTFVE